jgi:hypothetical protein
MTRPADQMRDAHDRVLRGESDDQIRPDVFESWQRSLAHGIDPEHQQPARFREVSETVALRREHPLSSYVPAMLEMLGDDTSGGRHLVVVTDVTGEVLWRIGSRDALRSAERIEFVEGANWSEGGIGTNAISHALMHDRPIQMYGGEHLVRTHHEWVCTAVPVHDPDRRVVGVLDVSSPTEAHHAGAWSLVRMGARMLEEMMRADRLAARLGGSPGAPAPEADISLLLLGPGRPRIDFGSGPRELTLRRAEILALLLSRDRGWSADELAYAMWGDTGVAASARVEVHRLRATMPDAVESAPYRLVREVVDCDADRVRRALVSGDVATAVRTYTGPLLEGSDSPEIAMLRAELHEAVRGSVLSSLDPALLEAWVGRAGNDDVAALRALVSGMSPREPQRAVHLARLQRLETELG